jgi:putative two-component system response regulator
MSVPVPAAGPAAPPFRPVADVAADRSRQLRLALESARVLLWEMDPASGRIRYEEEPEVLLEMDFRPELLPATLEEWLALVHPDDREEVHRRLLVAFDERGAFEAEYRVLLPDALIPVHRIETRGRVYDGGGAARMLGVSLDMTERRLQAERLREREETLAALFEASPTPITILDGGGRVVLASPATRTVFGYEPRAQRGTYTQHFVHPEDRERVAAAIERAMETDETSRMRFRYQHADGRWLVLEVDGRRLTDGAGGTTGLVAVSRDVTEHARLEEEVLRSRDQLEVRVRERTVALELSQVEILERLALAAEFRDDDTGRHTRRVGRNAARVARALGLGIEQVNLLRRAAPLHDVGKIGIPDGVFLKPGRLTDEEFAIVRTHTTIGARILSGGHFPLLRMAEEIALNHHERWDGRGYPNRLAGEEIPLVARIVSVVDVFDALTHARPYKLAWPVADALAELERERGGQFDPAVVDAFVALRRRDR